MSQSTFKSWGRWILSVLCTSMFMSYMSRDKTLNLTVAKPAFPPSSSKSKVLKSIEKLSSQIQVSLRLTTTLREMAVPLAARSLTTTYLSMLGACSSSCSSLEQHVPFLSW
jgi:hypothetical protein